MTKFEATLDNHQARELESYLYKNGQEIPQQNPNKEFSSAGYLRLRNFIDFALQNAKEGQDSGQKPDISQIPQN